MKIDCRKIASQILSNLKIEVDKLKAINITPHMYILLLTNNPATLSYIKQKQLYADTIGAKITVETLNLETTTDMLIAKINILNHDQSIHGIILQRPVTEQIDTQKIDDTILPEKEIDGFGENTKYEVPVAKAVTTILKEINPADFEEKIKQQRITVIGKGETAGEPIINSLRGFGVNLDIIDSKTENREFILANSDIVISATGKPNTIRTSDIKSGSIVIGVGLHLEEDGKLHGDYTEEEISKVASYYTSTPGGVGPVNVACLLENLVESAKNSLATPQPANPIK